MGRNPRAAAAALIRDHVPTILPRVVADAAVGNVESDTPELRRRLTTFLERRIPHWLAALEADNSERREAIDRLLQIDAAAGEYVAPVVVLGTIALGYRVIEAEIRADAETYGYSADELWREVDLLRRTVLETRRDFFDGGRVA